MAMPCTDFYRQNILCICRHRTFLPTKVAVNRLLVATKRSVVVNRYPALPMSLLFLRGKIGSLES
jgi:hypothetical protein